MSIANELRHFAVGLSKPPPKVSVDEWADTHRRLSPEASSEIGQWDTNRAPFQRGMMRAVTELGVKRIVFKTSAQVGKSEILLNILGYFMTCDPCPILFLQPNTELCEAFSKDRIDPMLRDTPILRDKVKSANLKNSGNTLLHKKFPGGQLTLCGAQSSSGLASRPIRVVMIDETDRAPATAGVSGSGQKEGDPIALAEKRTNNFFNSLTVLASTPTKKGSSRIDAAYEESDQRKFYIECPTCHFPQTLTFKQLKWDNHDPETTRYHCPSCEEVIDESLKHPLILNGQWKPSKTFTGVAGFHISELYSPWRKWKDIVAGFLKEKVTPERLQVWVNTTLGEVWEEKGEAPDWKKLYDRREPYAFNTLPKGVLLLTMGCDVQKTSIHTEIVGWCSDKRTYSIDYQILEGDTSTPEPWKKLDKLIGKRFTLSNGVEIPISMTAIDSGYNTQQVYTYVRSKPASRVMAVKGQETTHFILGHPTAVDINLRGRRITRGVKVWPVGVSVVKSELYGWLKLEKPVDDEEYPPGYCHFPEYDSEYFKMLTAEHLTTKIIRGYSRYIWEKTRPDNHALDCRVYARAAASAIGIDRMTEDDFDELRVELGLPPSGTPVECNNK